MRKYYHSCLKKFTDLCSSCTEKSSCIKLFSLNKFNPNSYLLMNTLDEFEFFQDVEDASVVFLKCETA
jgi:hypothetical protein